MVWLRDEGASAQEARMLMERGASAVALGRASEACAAYDEVARRFGDHRTPDVLYQVALAHHEKARVLYASQGASQSLPAWDACLSSVNATVAGLVDSVDRGLSLQLLLLAAEALDHKTTALCKLGREHEAVPLWDEIVRRFGEYDSPALVARVIRAQLTEANYHWHHQRTAEASAAFERAFARTLRFQAEPVIDVHAIRREEGDSPRFKPTASALMNALVTRAVALSAKKQIGEASVVWDEVLRRASLSDEDGMDECAALALMNKGAALVSMGRVKEAALAFQVMLEWFDENHPDSLVRDLRSQARGTLESFASSHSAPPSRTPALETLDDVQAASKIPQHAVGVMGERPKPLHFVNSRLARNDSVLELSYMAHDAALLRNGVTGEALLYNLFLAIEQQQPEVMPIQEVVVTFPRFRAPDVQDGNYALLMEAAAVFGLPLSRAAEQCDFAPFAAAKGLELRRAWLSWGRGFLCRYTSERGGE